MHDLDVTVRVIEYLIHSNPHSSADLEEPLHFEELVKNLEIWNIDILYEEEKNNCFQSHRIVEERKSGTSFGWKHSREVPEASNASNKNIFKKRASRC